MAVLAEAISVVVRKESIDSKYAGGWSAFVKALPNSTFCADDCLARVGFLNPDDVAAYIGSLSDMGLTYLIEGQAQDICVVDQQQGPMVSCDWLEFSTFSMEEGKVAATWLLEGPGVASGIHVTSSEMNLATPSGCTYKGSLSEKFHFLPSDSTRH